MIFEDETVWSDDIFKTTSESVAKDWSIFNYLRGQYKDYLTLKRKSNLSKTLSQIGSIEDVLSEELNSVAMIVTKSSIGINELVKNLTEKKSQILNVAKTLLQLQNKVTSKENLNSLRRQLKQMVATQNYTGTAKDRITVLCSNDCSLSWYSVLELLVEMENGVVGSWKRRHDKFLSISELISSANLLKDSTPVSEKELGFYISSRLQCEKCVFNVITQLVAH